MADDTTTPLDPRADDWLDAQRLERLHRDFGTSADFLALSGTLQSALEYWLRKEAADDVLADERHWPAQERQQQLDALEVSWRERHDPVERGLTDAQLRHKLAVAPGSHRWACAQWGHRLEQLFLARKADLDQASCRLLRVTRKPLAMELYHRVRAKEASFEQVAAQYGEGPERFQGGLLKLQPISRLPLGLAPVLTRLSAGELTMPQRLGEGFCLVQLVELRSATFDERTKSQLMDEELQRWLKQMLPVVQGHLISPDSSPAENR